ncbi:MAG: PD-(D/E)XK nuclease family protein, partial [Paracoccaceae bacterium]
HDERKGANRAANDLAVWSTTAEDSPPLIQAAKALRKEKQAQEDDRLLYVAMTRAQSVLIVGAAGKIGKNSTCWHTKISAGMAKLGASMDADGTLVHAYGDMPATSIEAVPDSPKTQVPDWAMRVAPPQSPVAPVVNPSKLGGAKALAGEAGQDTDVALARGGRLHQLLEHLPQHDPATWADMARALKAEDVLAEAQQVIGLHPELFAAGTMAEVAITAELDGRRLLGAIDRLVIGADRVLAVDFKSNRVVPQRPEDVPEGILRQMGAYAVALGQIYPGRRIETAILWTQSAQLLHLDPDMVSAALARALPIDVPVVGA